MRVVQHWIENKEVLVVALECENGCLPKIGVDCCIIATVAMEVCNDVSKSS